MPTDRDIQALFRQVASQEPEAVRRYLSAIEEGRAMAEGSTAVVPHLRLAQTRGLSVPEDVVPHPRDSYGVYLTLGDYLPLDDPLGEGVHPAELAAYFAHAAPREELLQALVMLNRISRKAPLVEDLVNEVAAGLQAEPAQRLKVALQGGRDGKKRMFLSRQVILRSLQLLLKTNPYEARGDLPPLVAAVFFVHGVATTLATRSSDEESRVCGFPQSLFMEVVQNSNFYLADEAYSVLDRYVRLWTAFTQNERFQPRQPPQALLREATSIRFRDLVGLGFLCYAAVKAWEPGRHVFLSRDLGIRNPPAEVARFIDLISATVDEIAAEIPDNEGQHWNFTMFQRHPILQLDEALIVIDEDFMLDRVTKGFYWDVHDHEKTLDDRYRRLWTQVYGEMVELATEDQLRRFSPIVLGGKSFYTEEDLERAYGRSKKCDVVIDFGPRFGLFEIVSGQLSTDTRSRGDYSAFERDTEKLVIKKARQLDAVAMKLQDDERRLTGVAGVTRERMVPVIIVGWGYPLTDLTAAYIAEQLEQEGLLQDPRSVPLCIVDIAELEMLEGLHSQGHMLPDVLVEWKESSTARMSLRNYLLERFGRHFKHFRPERVGEFVDPVLDGIAARLGLEESETQT